MQTVKIGTKFIVEDGDIAIAVYDNIDSCERCDLFNIPFS